MRVGVALLLASQLVPALGLGAAGLATRRAAADGEPAAPALDSGLSLVSLARRVRPSVLTVEVRGAGGRVTLRQAVVVDAEGWLVMAGSTPSAHDAIRVRTTAQQSVPALAVGSDAGSALTLLQLVTPPADLTPLPLPEVREREPLPAPAPLTSTVVMVGSDGAVARGPVRALERQRVLVDGAQGATRVATGLIEASLATVASDLGAPWVDAQGRCVGLLVGGLVEEVEGAEPLPPDVTMRAEPVAAHAVPAAVVSLVWPLLRSHQHVPRARLGVRVRAASDALRQHLCAGCGGQEVVHVEETGPAARGGVEVNDLIVALDGSALRPGATLADALLPYRPLDPLRVTVVRRGDRLEKTVILTAR